MATVREREKQLRGRLAELTGRLAGIEADLDEVPAQDWEDLAVEREDDEVLEGLGSAGLREVAMIRAALGRVKAGSYGICAGCGGQIEEERLDVLPETPVCRVCAQEKG